MVTIKYTKTGTCQVDESLYSDTWEDEDKPWSDLTDDEKIAHIKEVESDAGYECVDENTTSSNTVLDSITF